MSYRTNVFLHNMQTGETTLVDKNYLGNPLETQAVAPSISANGRYVTYSSTATDIIEEGTNGNEHIYRYDSQTDSTILISKATSGDEGNGASVVNAMSADGRYVAFCSYSSNFDEDDTGESLGIYLRDTVNNTTIEVSESYDESVADGAAYAPSISADGRYVAFMSSSSNIVEDDNNGGAWDVFVYDTLISTMTLESKSSTGVQGNSDSMGPVISPDGNYLLFNSQSTNLVGADNNGVYDLFVRNLQTGNTARVSVSNLGVEGNDHSYYLSISANGAYILFSSYATNLVANDVNGLCDAFVVSNPFSI